MDLPESLRDELKTPLGILIPEKDTTKQNIASHVSDSFVITVGDRTTQKMLEFGIIPSLQIVDGFEKRSKRIPPSSNAITMHCKNPAAQITPQSIQTIKNALLANQPVQILVDGEEDLLVIPVCIFAPENSVVLYGQPNEGLVVVSITQEIRNKTQSLLNRMIGV